jgi:hypothetical protein
MGLCCCKKKEIQEDPLTPVDQLEVAHVGQEENPLMPSDHGDLPTRATERKMSFQRKESNTETGFNQSNFKTFQANEFYEDNNEEQPVDASLCYKCFYDGIKNNFFLRVYVDHFEVFYKQCDDFGLVFKPYIELLINGQSPVRITNNDEEKLNNSGISDINTSFNSSTGEFNRLRSQMSFYTNTEVLKEGKVFTFKTTKNYILNRTSFYNSLVISVRNESSLFNHETSPITIGETRIPINLIENNSNNNCFDGLIELKVKNSMFVGYLKVVLALSHKSMDGHEELMKKMTRKKSFSDNLDFENSMFQKDTNVWERPFIHYNFLNPEVLDNYFIIDYDAKEKHIIKTDEFLFKVYGGNTSLNLDENIIPKDIDWNYLHKIFNESIAVHNENFILLYEMFIYLVKISNNNEFSLINDFFKNLSANEKNNFYNLPEFTDFNVHFLKYYLNFFFNYQRYFKSIKVRKFHLKLNFLILILVHYYSK